MTREMDPRVVRSREAIMEAARALLVEQGPSAVTHVLVAERAGTGRATVYRHWPRVDQLLSEAMAGVRLPFFEHPASPTRAWIRRELLTIARQLGLPEVRTVTATLASASLWDAELAARRDKLAGAMTERVAAALREASRRNEITLAVAPESAAALLLGPLFYRSFMDVGEPEDALIDVPLNAIGVWHIP